MGPSSSHAPAPGDGPVGRWARWTLQSPAGDEPAPGELADGPAGDGPPPGDEPAPESAEAPGDDVGPGEEPAPESADAGRSGLDLLRGDGPPAGNLLLPDAVLLEMPPPAGLLLLMPQTQHPRLPLPSQQISSTPTHPLLHHLYLHPVDSADAEIKL